jgi:hypothetical protein
MYLGEMECMWLSFALILGLHPSTIAGLSNTTRNLPKLVSLGPIHGKEASCCNTLLQNAIYMYFGEMESMGLSLPSILGMRPSTFAHLSNTTSNLPK